MKSHINAVQVPCLLQVNALAVGASVLLGLAVREDELDLLVLEQAARRLVVLGRPVVPPEGQSGDLLVGDLVEDSKGILERAEDPDLLYVVVEDFAASKAPETSM